jgi:hypothetical protein
MSTGELNSAANRLEFSFVGATNLHDASAPHMEHLSTILTDRDHFTEQWTKTEGGKTTLIDLHFVRR